LIAYWTAYLKCHYPAEYMAALLTSVSDDKDRMAPYLRECKRLGIRVKPPHIDLSAAGFRVLSEDEILFGLQGIDGIGPAVAGAVLRVRTRPYASVYDFFRHCPPEIMDKGNIESFIGSGSLDHLAPQGVVLTRSEKAGVLETEKKYLGAYITEHPLSASWIFLEPQVTSTIEGLEPLPVGQRVTIAGVMSSVQRKRSKKNNDAVYYNFELGDLTDRLEVVVFPKDAESLNPVEGEIVLVTGRLARDGDEEKSVTKLLFENMRRPELPEDLGGPPIRLRLKEPPGVALIKKLSTIIDECPGDSPVYMEFPEGPHEVVFRFYETTSMEGEKMLRVVTGD
jgi:DNA polymerase-3 subunit alpha